MSLKDIFSRKKSESHFEWEPLPDVDSMNNVPSWTSRYLSINELEDAKEKLFTVLNKDLKISPSYSKMLVNHVLGVKAMYNAGYAREYIMKLLISRKLVQELYDTKVKLRHMNKQYARASKTIFELKARLSFAWRREVADELRHTLDRIETVQKQIMEKQND